MNLSPQMKLKRLIAPEKSDIYIVVIYGLCSGLLSLVIPISVQTLVNTISFGSMLQPVFVLTFIVLLVLGGSALMRGLQIFIMEIIQQRLFARMALQLAQKIPGFQIKSFDSSQGPELINRFFDVLTVQKSTALIVLDGVFVLLQTVVGLVLLGFYHPFLLVFDLILLALILGVILFLGKGAIYTSILESKAKYAVASWLQELARIPILFKHPEARNFILNRADHLTVDYVQNRKAHFKILMSQIVGTLSLQVIASSVLLGLGGLLVIKRQLTLGQLVASELIVTSVLTGVGKFGKYLECYYDLVAAADKLDYLLNLPEEEQGPLPAAGEFQNYPAYSICFNEIEYAYLETTPCLTGVTFRAQKGQKVVIYGARASGKSTLCDLLYQLKQPLRGTIQLNGIDSRDCHSREYREKIAFLRDAELMDGTLFDNLKIHRENLTLREAYAACEKVGVLKEIHDFPLGLMTPVSAGRVPLSQGQAKLLALARAILSEPKLFVLDGFLDDLDDESKNLALRYFLQECPATVVMTTHSMALAQTAKSYWVLEKGRLI